MNKYKTRPFEFRVFSKDVLREGEKKGADYQSMALSATLERMGREKVAAKDERMRSEGGQ